MKCIIFLCLCHLLDPEVHPQNEEYWGHVNPIGPRACYDEGKRVAETMCYAYMKQVGVKLRKKICSSTTFFPWPRQDDDETTPRSLNNVCDYISLQSLWWKRTRLNPPIRAFLLLNHYNLASIRTLFLCTVEAQAMIWKHRRHQLTSWSSAILIWDILLKWKFHSVSLCSFTSRLRCLLRLNLRSTNLLSVLNCNKYIVCNCGCWINALMQPLCDNTKCSCFNRKILNVIWKNYYEFYGFHFWDVNFFYQFSSCRLCVNLYDKKSL